MEVNKLEGDAPEGDYVQLTAEQKQALNRAHLASAKVVTSFVSLPKDLVQAVLLMLRGALDCKTWVWSPEQWEAADTWCSELQALLDAEKQISAKQKQKPSKKISRTARLREYRDGLIKEALMLDRYGLHIQATQALDKAEKIKKLLNRKKKAKPV